MYMYMHRLLVHAGMHRIHTNHATRLMNHGRVLSPLQLDAECTKVYFSTDCIDGMMKMYDVPGDVSGAPRTPDTRLISPNTCM